MDFDLKASKIFSKIKQAKNILLVIHRKPDGDALGSASAFSQFLSIENKNHSVFCLDQPPAHYLFLTGFNQISNDPTKFFKKQFDLIIVFDSGDLEHAGLKDLLPKLSPRPFLINIDHHLTNQNFGDLNLVNPQAVSTTEIIFQLFYQQQFKISKEIATSLLTGIVTDTLNFTNPNTTFYSLKIAAELLLVGARLPQINEFTFKNKTLATLKLWGRILTRLTKNHQLGIVTTVVTNQDLAEYQIEAELTDGIANFLNNLTDVKAALILKEQGDGTIKGSLRTSGDLIDLVRLAKILGGGGHQKAAGFTIKGSLVKSKQGYWQII